MSLMPLIGGKYIWRVPGLNVDGYYSESNEDFEYLGCFGHGCSSMPDRHSPSARQGNIAGPV
jgi:hypothetical protein